MTGRLGLGGTSGSRLSASAGAVLLAALLIVSMVMLLAALAVQLATSELSMISASREEAVTRYLAEAGSALVLQWLHDPLAVPEAIPADLFEKRHEDPARGPSFFDRQGRSQFQGDARQPDLLLLASNPEHGRLLHHSPDGLLRDLVKLGRLEALRLYGPERLGLLGTVETTVRASGSRRTTTVQLGIRRIPRLRAGVQLGWAAAGRAVPLQPLWVHWGDVVVNGDAVLGSLRDVTTKDSLAPVTGRSFGDMPQPEDRWVDYRVAGDVRVLRPPDPRHALPGNVHANQHPIPGLPLDPWDYHVLKAAAIQFGSYYVLGGDGYLYRDGTTGWERRRTIDQAMASEAVGDHRGLVFIDTPERRPPGPRPLQTVTLTAPYAEGLFVVNAHVRWRPGGAGQPVPAVSPPPEGTDSRSGRVSVVLPGIHLQGVLVTPGRVLISGRPRVFGGLSSGARVEAVRMPHDRLEVWYSHELGAGLARGMPLAYVVPGSRTDRW